MDSEHASVEPAPRHDYMPVEGALLYCREIGRGQPIIILHGGPSLNHHYLLPDMDRLAGAFRLIYYDQRGRGRSARNVQPDEVSLASEVDDLDRLRAHFHLESVALLGHSWGALLAMEYAIRHPERVSHLILLNTAPASYEDYLLFQQERRSIAPDDMELLSVLESRPAFVEGELDARAEYSRVDFRATLRPPELLDRLVEQLRVGWSNEDFRKARAVAERLWNEAYESTDYTLLPKLTQLRIPTLVLHGDYDFVPITSAVHIAEAIPGARLVVLRNCGHFSYLERPGEFYQAITELFQSG